jgi:hypothetical protein
MSGRQPDVASTGSPIEGRQREDAREHPRDLDADDP